MKHRIARPALMGLVVIIAPITAACQLIPPVTSTSDNATPSVDVQENSGQDYLDQGMELFAEGEFEEALKDYDRATKLQTSV